MKEVHILRLPGRGGTLVQHRCPADKALRIPVGGQQAQDFTLEFP
jgi:hypothetical protein